MSVIPNQRKTYMMLSKQNAEHFILDKETNAVLRTFDTTHTTKHITEHEDPLSHVVSYQITNVPNAMYTFRFPDAFINSKNPRWVEIHHCKCTFNGVAATDLILHTDIIARDPYLDHAVMNVNETRTKYKKYEYTRQEHYFTIWFTRFGNPDQPVNDNQINFLCEMMLIY